jgi:hypothetical protein
MNIAVRYAEFERAPSECEIGVVFRNSQLTKGTFASRSLFIIIMRKLMQKL